MVNSKLLTKNRVFGISDEMDDLLKLYSCREGVSLSEMIRISLKEKVEKLRLEEEKFWLEMPTFKLREILNTLTDHLDSELSSNGSGNCEHSTIWENNHSENFEHTRDFCHELQIELHAFLKRIETDFKMTFDCECGLYEKLMERRNNNG